jgi:hypothetical protein
MTLTSIYMPAYDPKRTFGSAWPDELKGAAGAKAAAPCFHPGLEVRGLKLPDGRRMNVVADSVSIVSGTVNFRGQMRKYI